ncbi:hypothetical protein SALBM217S_01783 [Streptomyces griseoloalbus]
MDGSVVSPIWPPTGIAVASLLLLGPRVWPGIALGALLVVAHLTSLQPVSPGTVFGNTAAPLCAYLLLRAAGFRTDLARLRDCLSLVFLGGFADAGQLHDRRRAARPLRRRAGGPLLVGVAALVGGDAMGVLLIAPVLLVLPRVRSPSTGSTSVTSPPAVPRPS